MNQRSLFSLGKVEEGRLEELATAISKHLDLSSTYDLAKDMDVSQTYILGPLLVLEHLMGTFGISSLLQAIIRHNKRLQLPFEKIIFSLLCSRFIR